MEIVGQKSVIPDAGAYRVLLKLRLFAAKQIGIDPTQPLVVRFDNGNDAWSFHALARSRSTELRLPWGKDRAIVLQPSAWSCVTMQTPQGVIATPASVSISSTP